MSLTNLNVRHRVNSQTSFRKRIMRTNSEEQKQLTKTSTATSFRPKLQRLIKEGKIQQIIYSDPHSKADLYYKTHINQLQKQLGAAKKSLNTMVLKSKAKQYAINKLKNQLNKIERESGIMRGESAIASKTLLTKKQQLQDVRNTLQDNLWLQKSYTQIKGRLYTDELILKARYQRLQQTYYQAKRQLKQLQDKFYEMKQYNRQLTKMTDEAKKISKVQAEQKNQFVDLLNQQMAEKDMLDNLKYDKNKRDQEINQLQASQIEKQQLAKYMHILFTHRLLSQINKSKSNKMIKKYEGVQKAFMHIKSNTNISNMQKILQKMEQQDQLYQNALKRVNFLQIEKNRVQDQVQEIEQRRNQIYSMDGQKHFLKKDYYQGIAKDQYELLQSQKEKLLARKRSDQIITKRLHNWAQELYPGYGVQKGEKMDFHDALKILISKISGKPITSEKTQKISPKTNDNQNGQIKPKQNEINNLSENKVETNKKTQNNDQQKQQKLQVNNIEKSYEKKSNQ